MLDDFSKSQDQTLLEYNIIPSDKYTYLFRSWKGLLLTAKILKNIYIINYDKKILDIKKQHENLQKYNFNIFENDDDNDLPIFLKFKF